MTLGQILERQFFRSYIKEGHILMLTSGKKAIDDTFVLQDGTLTLYLGKESYEKAGLVGRPYGAKGNRKLKPRWVINLDLKSSSMVHGKKGFDRLLYACENVFSQPFTWLFSNLSAEVPSPDPLQQYSPEQAICHPSSNEGIETTKVAMHIDPSIVASGDRPAMEAAAADLYEWLSLVRLDSPRIQTGDSIDAYLSRYDAPDAATGTCNERCDEASAASLVRHRRDRALWQSVWCQQRGDAPAAGSA
ncbi:ribonuclease P 40kDa (Rpp40) subunit domain-containing protein [Sarocladium implicatum]|nr:ribonuclease P 40kDa (Rpp40) subunit domain-containing protein [Sarocladium implicatum]